MKDLSLHILDIAMNSVKAGAKNVSLSLTEKDGIRTFSITDDGCGMSPEFLRGVTDPFTTTRTTRPVGLGIPLIKMAAEQAGGSFNITSSQGADHGTTLTASFDTSNIDCIPVGDFPDTVAAIVHGAPDIDFEFIKDVEGEKARVSTREMREILGDDIPLTSPDVLAWIRESMRGEGSAV